MSSHQSVLGIFAKWPHVGQVKTRLAKSLGPEIAAGVARAFLLDTLDRLAGLPVRRILVFTPVEDEAEFNSINRGRFTLQPQTDGDLGCRMAEFFTQAIEAGARSVVAVGTDSPTLPVAHVEQAFAHLRTADVVLGPATDGGYYLIGCGPRLPPVFDGMSWGGPRVLNDTIARLSDWELHLLPPWYDIDTLDDWEMLRGHVAALHRTGMDPGVPHVEALMREMG